MPGASGQWRAAGGRVRLPALSLSGAGSWTEYRSFGNKPQHGSDAGGGRRRMGKTGMTLLSRFNVVQIGGGAAATVCGRLLADVGAQVVCIDPDAGTPLLACLNRGKAF